MDILNEQKEQVQKVTFLENFNKDNDISLQYNTDIFKGVAISFKNDYVISEKDIAWLHPNIAQTTAMYKGGTFTTVKEGYDSLAPFNSVAGLYNIHSIDEIGTPCVQKYTIIQTYSDEDVQDLHNNLIGKTIKQAYDYLATQEVDRCPNIKDKTLSICNDLASKFTNTSEKALFTQTTNAFFKAKDGIQFHNHALPLKEQRLVMVSPLNGFKLVKTKDKVIPSDLMSNNYFNMDSMSVKQQERIFFNCLDVSNEAFNTFTLKKALPVKLEGASYIMEKANFSSTPIHNKLSPIDKFKLTPKYIPESANVHSHIKKGNIQVNATPDIIHKLLGVEDIQILNPKYFKNNALVIPRSVLKQII